MITHYFFYPKNDNSLKLHSLSETMPPSKRYTLLLNKLSIILKFQIFKKILLNYKLYNNIHIYVALCMMYVVCVICILCFCRFIGHNILQILLFDCFH